MTQHPFSPKESVKSTYPLDKHIRFPLDRAKAMFGMTVQEAHAEEICVRCKRAFTPDDYSILGNKLLAFSSYSKFGMCSFCYEEWADEDFEGDARTYTENDKVVSALVKKVYHLTKEYFPLGEDKSATLALLNALTESGVEFRSRTDISPRRCAENIILKTKFGLQYGTDDWQRIVQHPAVASAMKPLQQDLDKWFGSLPGEDQIRIRLGCTNHESTVAKSAALRMLAKERKKTQWVGYGNIGDYHGGEYECDYVSPYTKTAGNVEAEVFVLLQDWSSDSWLKKPLNKDVQLLGYQPNLLTNKTLARLLQQHFKMSLSDIYATNLFPFVKLGGLGEGIHRKHLVQAAEKFALPQIKIVRPVLVICLGLETFNSMRAVCGFSECKLMSSAIESGFTTPDNVRFLAQAHTGYWGQKNRNKLDGIQVQSDWRRMRQEFESLKRQLADVK